MLMTFVEVTGLIIVMIIGIVYIAQGNADFGGCSTDISVTRQPGARRRSPAWRCRSSR